MRNKPEKSDVDFSDYRPSAHSTGAANPGGPGQDG